jgi:hypothetical protein
MEIIAIISLAKERKRDRTRKDKPNGQKKLKGRISNRLSVKIRVKTDRQFLGVNPKRKYSVNIYKLELITYIGLLSGTS